MKTKLHNNITYKVHMGENCLHSTTRKMLIIHIIVVDLLLPYKWWMHKSTPVTRIYNILYRIMAYLPKK